MLFPVLRTEASQALQTRERIYALDLCVEETESTCLIHFPYQRELWLISSGPKKQAYSSKLIKAYSSKQAFIFTHHTPPAPPHHQRPHSLVSYEDSIFHGKP